MHYECLNNIDFLNHTVTKHKNAESLKTLKKKKTAASLSE